MCHRAALILATTLLAFALDVRPSVGAEPPNVLMLVVDDFNDWGGAIGAGEAVTPNLDRLAERGMHFTNAHVPGTYCTPSRTAIMTGRHPATTGCYSNNPYFYSHPELVSIPGHFRSAGYKTVGGGKIFHHMPGFVDLEAYDEYFHWNPAQKSQGWGLFAWRDNPATPDEAPLSCTERSHLEHGMIPNAAEKDMADTRLVDWAVDFVGQDHEQPFFLSLGLYAPHKPNYVPRKYFDLYPPGDIYTPPIKKDDLDDLPPRRRKQASVRKKRVHDLLVECGEVTSARRAYLAALSYADAQLGRVLEALSASPHARDTIIVFWSDHGWHLGEKFQWGKHTLWERTSNVHFIWAGPGIPRGVRYDHTVTLLDIYPTLIDAAGVKNRDGLDGRSLVDLFRDPTRNHGRAVVVADKSGKEFAVVTDRWRYIRREDGEELYDLRSDPHEWNNLAGKATWRPITEKLTQHLPAHPAPMVPDKRDLRLVIDGKGFHWEAKERRGQGNR